MCIHEIWTYTECGCRIDHHVSCFVPRTSHVHSPVRLKHASASSYKLPPSPLPTDSEDDSCIQSDHRSCSINRTVHKSFLEPICDDCLLEEMGYQNAKPSTNDLREQKSRVWDSNVEIEVDEAYRNHRIMECRRSTDTKIFESDVQVHIAPSPSPQPSSTPFPVATPALSRLSTDDADSESSSHDNTFRGRARSRTKQLRRMAMDVSREELRLRISSRLPSFQREHLQNFKNELQRGRNADTRSPGSLKRAKPMRSFVQRFAGVQEERWSKAREKVQGLGWKMGHKSDSPLRAPRSRSPATFGLGVSDPMGNRRHLRMVEEDCQPFEDAARPSTANSSGTSNFYLHQNGPFYPGHNVSPDVHHDTDVSHARSESDSRSHSPTWQSHLIQDLTNKKRARHQINLSASEGGSDPSIDEKVNVSTNSQPSQLSGSTTSTAVSSQNWNMTHPSQTSNPFSHHSYEYSTTNADEFPQILTDESQRRLLSISSGPSIPTTASNASFSARSRMEAHRIASLMGPEEFDDPDDRQLPVKNIDEELAMVGLRGHFGARGRSTSTMENLPGGFERLVDEVEPIVAVNPVNPPRDDETATDRDVLSSPSTAIRKPGTFSNRNASFASRMLASQDPAPSQGKDQGGSPTSVPSSILANGANLQSPDNPPAASNLAIHALSTPFHHSLRPHATTTTTYQQSIDTVLNNNRMPNPLTSHPTNNPAPQTGPPQRPLPTPAPRPLTPEAPADFALNTSPTSLFSCVWLRSTCPGTSDLSKATPDANPGESNGENTPASSGSANVVPKHESDVYPSSMPCGALTTFKVRSCLCSGRVVFADHTAYQGQEGLKSAKPKTRGGREMGLEGRCRATAPIVRYVVGERLCVACQ